VPIHVEVRQFDVFDIVHAGQEEWLLVPDTLIIVGLAAACSSPFFVKARSNCCVVISE